MGVEKNETGDSTSPDSDEGCNSEEEYDSELEALLRENSNVSSSDSEDEGPRDSNEDGESKGKARRKGRGVYESPASTIAVLIVACWTLRIPVMYRDFTQ